MALVLLGNLNPAQLDEPSITRVNVPEGRKRVEALREIVDLWSARPFDAVLESQPNAHASEGDRPEWVESDDHALAELLAEHWTGDGHVCTVGRPDNWTSLGDEWTIENGATTPTEE